MTRRLERDVRTWLEAEQAGSDELAERALARALGRVDRRAPAPGFANRVLMAAGRVPRATVASAWRSLWLRAAVIVFVLAAGAAVAVAPPLWLPAGHLIARALGSPILPGLWHWMGQWVTFGLASWSIVEDIAAAVRGALVSREAVMVLVTNIGLAAASLAALRRVLGGREVQPPAVG